ncbi:MAG TPA: Plug domain-containing protein [Longimicrobiales bacterium]|nr:Plug domain-containing protein [Longimicrobiales bacterium]
MSCRVGFDRLWSKPVFFFCAAFLVVVPPLTAQQRPPPDSLRQDSLRRARQDSLRRAGQDTTQVVADSLKPPPILAKHIRPFSATLGGTVREWTRDDLLLEGAMTLGDLLQQIPGITTLRSGLFLQPEAVAILGQSRGGLQIVLDGYELDPLTEAASDLSRIELVHLNHVRVERRLDLTRIELSTLEPTDGRAHSRIEAGVGEPNVSLFRGVFLAPDFLIGPLGLAIERIDTDGYRGEPADVFAGWAKWAFIRGETGIQAEYRQTGLNRSTGSPWPGESSRSDLIVRARAPLGRGVVLELFGGRSTFDNDTITAQVDPDSTPPAKPTAEALQYGARASYQNPYFWADASFRMRDHDALPSMQLDAAAGVRLGRYAVLNGAATQANWGDAGTALSYDLQAQFVPALGLYAFGEIAGGERGALSAYFLPVDSLSVEKRSGLRAGIGFQRWGIDASAALLQVEQDSVQSFGLPFDTTDARFGNHDFKGFEVVASVPLGVQSLRLIGYYQKLQQGTRSIYAPQESWRAALQYHGLPLKSGNLELLARVEARGRGDMLAPVLSTAGWATEVLPRYLMMDAYLQIRIIDVRLFIRGENMNNEEVAEVSGRTVRTPRYLYGVKWTFWN